MTCPSEFAPLTELESSLVSPIQLIVSERRSRVRYPLVLMVRYRTLGQRLHSGHGQAVNLSSGGALVSGQHELRVGTDLEVSIEWPTLLDGCVPLQLVAISSVVRCGPCCFAVSFRRHQFRTLRSPVQPIALASK
jgi:hypothetical protein